MASFEESLTRLETVVAKLESGELTLEQSVDLYEEGVKLSDACKAELEKAEGRVQVVAKGRGGRAELVEFVQEDSAGLDDEP